MEKGVQQIEAAFGQPMKKRLLPSPLLSKVFSPDAMSALCSDAQLLHWAVILTFYCLDILFIPIRSSHFIEYIYIFIGNSTNIK